MIATMTGRALRSVVTQLPMVGCLIACVIVWQLIPVVADVPAYILPPPTDVFSVIQQDYSTYLAESVYTVRAIVVGFVLAVVVMTPLAIGSLYIPRFDEAVFPILVASKVMPKVALAPLFVIWFGYGFPSIVAMTCLIAFFPMLLDAVLGLRGAQRVDIELFRSLRASRVQEFFKLRLPAALPSIFMGLKLGMVFAIVGAIVGEFVGTTNGLGYLILVHQANLETTEMVAVLVWLATVGFVLYGVVRVLELIVLGRRAGSALDTARST